MCNMMKYGDTPYDRHTALNKSCSRISQYVISIEHYHNSRLSDTFYHVIRRETAVDVDWFYRKVWVYKITSGVVTLLRHHHIGQILRHINTCNRNLYK